MHSAKKVFISYAHEGTLGQRVRDLAVWLREKGVDTITDHDCSNRPPELGWRAWMQHSIENADIVLIVCTERYKSLFEKRKPEGNGGMGVTWEGAIITSDLYYSLLRNNRYFPILPDEGDYDHIPKLLGDWSNNCRFPSNHDGILRLIEGNVSTPSIGKANSNSPNPSKQGHTGRKNNDYPSSPFSPPDGFHSTSRIDLLEQLNRNWLNSNKPVAIIQGFPGTGKTKMASSIRTDTLVTLDPISVSYETDDIEGDLLVDLALSLEAHGYDTLALELEKGLNTNPLASLERIIRRERVIIVIDEFQRLLMKETGRPPRNWEQLIERLNNASFSQGKLLLISNRIIEIDRWSEGCLILELKKLPDAEAADFLRESLIERNLHDRVPNDRLTEIGKRLGGNFRAIKTLIGSLEYYSIEELFSDIPHNWRQETFTWSNNC